MQYRYVSKDIFFYTVRIYILRRRRRGGENLVEPFFLGYPDELAPAADVELLIDIVQVDLNRACAYAQSVCDIFVREVLSHQADDLGLASRDEAGEPTRSGLALEQFFDRACDGLLLDPLLAGVHFPDAQ